MHVISILPGAKLARNNETTVLFGCPPEVIKFISLKKLPFPDCIVLPDTLYFDGVLQNCTEFPLYYFLFVQGNLAKGTKLTIIGEATQLANNRELLRLTLLGPTQEEYARLGTSSTYRELYKEARSLALKNKQGQELSITDLVTFLPFTENQARVGEWLIKHKDKNTYEIDGKLVDIRLTTPQIPPYELNPNYTPMMPSRFGIDVLGGGSGFTPNRPCSGLLLNYNSDYMLIDSVPYLDYSLKARGVCRRQIKSIFLSHIHDDHCNIFPLVLFNNKMKFLGTKEIYWMALQKLALQTMTEIDQFYSYFDFVELTAYVENEFYGLTIIPHYTVHSIPTIGATFTMKDQGTTRSIVFIGDNKSLPGIEELVKKRVVTKKKFDYLKKLYHDPYDLLFPDGGMGILHGDPKDSLGSRANRIVFQHLEDLPSEFDATFSLSRAGKRYSIIDATQYTYIIRTISILQDNFPGISHDWVNSLMNRFKIVAYNLEDVIMKQGELSKGIIYIILSGKCSVMYHDGKKLKQLAIKEAGDFIGDMAIVMGDHKRSASIVAHTPVTLCEIDEQLFYTFLQAEDRIATIKTMWKIRRDLGKNYPFNSFSDFVNEKLARVSRPRKIATNTEVIRQGDTKSEFYIVQQGSFLVEHNGKKVSILKEGHLFGEYGSLAGTERNATIRALEPSTVLEISNEDISRIVAGTPILNFYLRQLMKKRKEKLEDLKK